MITLISTRRMAIGSLVIILASFAIPIYTGFALTPITITVDSSKLTGTNTFSVGFQLDGPDIRYWRDRSALRELAANATMKLVRFFEHRLGYPCTRWNEATKTGSWDWTDLDPLIEEIFDIGAEPLIALGFIGYDSKRLTSVPSGMSYDTTTGLPKPEQWAAYCAEWVNHFKKAGYPVRFYEMINEAYHYFGWPATQPKLGYFMNLYNAAYKAMKAVNPNILVGNDACILKSVLNYFISNGEKLDFLSFHSYGATTTSASDGEIFQAAETKYITETTSVYGVEKTRQLYKTAKGIDLPVIHAENNLDFYFSTGTDIRIQKMQGAVYNALTFRTSMLNNYLFNSYFHFASSASQEAVNPTGGLGFGMVNLDDNKPWYPYYVHQMLANNLAVGDKLVQSTSSSDDIRTIAWIHENKLNTLLICKVDAARTISLSGLSSQVQYSKIDNTISYKTPKVQTGTINSSNALTFNGYTVMLTQSAVPVTPQPPPPTNFVFQDGFESGNFALWNGTKTSSSETVAISTSSLHHGTYDARFTSNGGGGIEYSNLFKNINMQEVYARGYFRIVNNTANFLTDNGDRFYFMRLASESQSLVGVGVRREAGKNQWILYTRDGSSWVGPVYSASPTIQPQRWYCIELHWSAKLGLAEMYVDGVKILQITNVNTNSYGNANRVDVGLVSATNVQNQMVIYADCFKLSNTYNGPET